MPHLELIGKDPLAIDVHFHNMFYAYPQRGRVMRGLSAVDIALWDVAGKLLGQSVCRMLVVPSGTRFHSTPKAYKIDIIVHCHNELDLPSAIKVAESVERPAESPATGRCRSPPRQASLASPAAGYPDNVSSWARVCSE